VRGKRGLTQKVRPWGRDGKNTAQGMQVNHKNLGWLKIIHAVGNVVTLNQINIINCRYNKGEQGKGGTEKKKIHVSLFVTLTRLPRYLFVVLKEGGRKREEKKEETYIRTVIQSRNRKLIAVTGT